MFLWENTFKIPMSEATCTCPLDHDLLSSGRKDVRTPRCVRPGEDGRGCGLLGAWSWGGSSGGRCRAETEVLEADGDTKMRRRLVRGNGNMQAGTYPLPPPVLGPAAGEHWPGVGGTGTGRTGMEAS